MPKTTIISDTVSDIEHLLFGKKVLHVIKRTVVTNQPTAPFLEDDVDNDYEWIHVEKKRVSESDQSGLIVNGRFYFHTFYRILY